MKITHGTTRASKNRNTGQHIFFLLVRRDSIFGCRDTAGLPALDVEPTLLALHAGSRVHVRTSAARLTCCRAGLFLFAMIFYRVAALEDASPVIAVLTLTERFDVRDCKVAADLCRHR